MRRAREHRIGLGWGLVDQGFSSATNFGLSVLAGRLLGPSGLGNVFLAFVAYTLVLEFQHSLLQEPYVVASSHSSSSTPTRHALALGLCYELSAAGLFALLGAVLPGAVGHGLLAIAPWMVPLLFQDLCRSVLFKDRRGGLATASDAMWAVGMAAALPLAVSHRSVDTVIACWAIGASAGALAGLLAIRKLPTRPREAIAWWRSEAAPLGRWLGMESVAYVVGTQGAVFFIAWFVGEAQLGGLRAVQSAFAPMSLVGPALRMPGLPAIARATKRGDEAGRRAAKVIAVRLSAAALALIVVYFSVLETIGGRLLSAVFGKSFVPFRNLILPVGLGQLAGASALGFYILLRAQSRGRTVFGTRVITALATLVLIPPLALTHGVYGAAWGTSLGAAVGWVVVATVALRGPWTARRTRRAPDERLLLADVEPAAASGAAPEFAGGTYP
jgi:O-antigen/teichoic acid export membrane protein